MLNKNIHNDLYIDSILLDLYAFINLLEFGSEDFIPDFAGDTVSIISINVVMLIVISLHFPQVFNKRLAMVDINVSHIVANISDDKSDSKESSKVAGKEICDGWEEDGINDQSEDGREDESIGVHRDSVMDTVDNEMEIESVFIIRKGVIEMEDSSVKSIFC